jgi:hypothetical protein
MTEERTPAEILEAHARESIDRINKIDTWVRRVSFGLIGLVLTCLIIVVMMGFAFSYLVNQIDESRYDSAVKGCQINRQAGHDSISALMVGLSKTKKQEEMSRTLADQYFKYDEDTCKSYAKAIGLEP